MTKARVPLAFHAGSPHPFEPTEEQWQEIGGDYCTLDDADRLVIAAIVNDYFTLHHCGRTGTYADAAAFCRKIQKAAEALEEALSDNPGFNALGAAQAIGEGNINSRIGRVRPFDLCRFKDELSWLAPACENVCREFRKEMPRGFQPYDQWKLMAGRLIDWAHSKGLKPSASKAGYGKISPFVRFIDRLQACFPKELRAFHNKNPSSKASLSKELAAIKRARSKRVENLAALAEKNPAQAQ